MLCIHKVQDKDQISKWFSFSYIVEVSFIGGGNQHTQRKPPICRKALTRTLSHNVVSSTHRRERCSNSQR